MPFNLKDEEEVKQFLENLGIEYRFACFKERKPDGCHLLGDYLESIKKDFRRAAQVYKDNCDERDFAHSCHKFGVYAYLGKGTPEDRQQSFDYQMKSCDLGNAKGCFMSGLQLTGEGSDVKRGLAMLQRACELGSGDGCHHASAMYLTGKESIAVDYRKAFEFAVKACDLGNIYACQNVSLLYAKGMGVEQDKAMAKKYREKVLDYQEQFRSTRTVTMEEGIDPV